MQNYIGYKQTRKGMVIIITGKVVARYFKVLDSSTGEVGKIAWTPTLLRFMRWIIKGRLD